MEKKFEKKTGFGYSDIQLGFIQEITAKHPSLSQFENSTVGELAQHILECHAEIDRRLKVIKRQSRRLKKKSLVLKAAQIVSDVNERAIQSAESALHAKDEEIKEYNSLRSDLLNLVGSYDEDLNLFSTDMEILEVVRKLVAQPVAEREWISRETHEKFPETGVWFSVGKEYQDAAIKGIGDKPVSGRRYTLALPLKDFPVPPKPLEVKVGKYQWGKNGKTCTILDVGQEYCIYRFNGQSRAILHQPIETMKRMMHEANARFVGEGDNQ